MIVTCQECGSQISDSAVACPKCGAPADVFLGRQSQCVECGGPYRAAESSCRGCGAPREIATLARQWASEQPTPKQGAVAEQPRSIAKQATTVPHDTPPAAQDASKGGGSNWLLWWQINHQALEDEASNYSAISFWKSARAAAVACILVSMAITTVAIYFNALGMDQYAFFDVALWGVIALFVGLGSRWALVSAMIYWTIAKVLLAYASVQEGVGFPALPSIIWWAVYMHAFYFALRVEMRRRRIAQEALSVARNKT